MIKRFLLLMTFVTAFTAVGASMPNTADAWGRWGYRRPYMVYYGGPPAAYYGGYGPYYRGYAPYGYYGPRVYRSYYGGPGYYYGPRGGVSFSVGF